MPRRILLRLIALCAALSALAAPLSGALAAGAEDYRIEVDIANQITTVYRCADGAVVRQMICSTGTGDNTPRGTFYLQKSRAADRSEWYFIGKYQCYVKYPTRIQGSILFHSLPYAAADMTTLDEEARAQLGSKASHGCVRLRWRDAQWIAENCPDGTETRIFTGATRESALRKLLLKRSYRAEGGQSYEAFVASARDDGPASLGRGNEGTRVEALQRRLGRLGFFAGPATGVYDAATVIAVTRYQSSRGLPATGIADDALFERILAEAREQSR